MNEHFCTYAGKRDEVLVAYLYGELAADERAAFDRHVATCAPCRVELTALGGVRSDLARWTPPESATQIPFTLPPPHPRKSIGAVIREIPAWAQLMAATLILGAAAGLANLNVHYNADGLSIRTGWRQSASDPTARAVAPAATPSVSASTAPWRSDLAALEQQLRTEFQTHPATASSASTPSSDDAVLRRVRQLIEDSERRQQSELALRVAEVTRDMQSQRQADLVKIDRTLGLIQNSSRIEVMRTQRQVNSLAQQVSQRP
jgi:anti-sigma factor RsiW